MNEICLVEMEPALLDSDLEAAEEWDTVRGLMPLDTSMGAIAGLLAEVAGEAGEEEEEDAFASGPPGQVPALGPIRELLLPRRWRWQIWRGWPRASKLS